MKCYYYLSPNLASTERISEDLHQSGVSDWFMHIICKDEAGLCRKQLHSSNYLETLDLVRHGLIGAICGLATGIGMAALATVFNPFGAELSTLAYAGIIILMTGFGTWQGGLVGISMENKKLEKFHHEVEAGKYLILVYAHKSKEENVARMMTKLHPEAKLVGVDRQFFNPFSMPEQEPTRKPA
ncbi:hypothetical protein ACXYTJ_00815 [Gilvimarinus sp. F26214L]|uniref:hypothetical protein n=1 Tax=Gilvimarinus sp. DZF01 TaxID=3461371 RepID=UPI0040466229